MTRTVAVALAAAIVLVAPALAADPPKSVTLPAKNGAVRFDHEAHQKRTPDCKACHPGATPVRLAGKDEAHALCQACHKAKKAGPTTCGACHKKP